MHASFVHPQCQYFSAAANILLEEGRDALLGVDVEDAGAAITVTLSDQGPGIEEADRVRALQRFVRLDESRGGDGSGLGLSLIAAICRHHGGSLTLADNAPGLCLIMHIPKA